MNNLFCGIDLGTRSSAICIINEEKDVVERWKGKTVDISSVLSKHRKKIQCVVEAGPLSESVCKKVEACGKSEDLLVVWQQSHDLQKRAYKDLARIAKRDEVTARLMTVPGVGPATALAFASAIDTPTRFKSAKQVSGYLGLAPRVHQSGDLNYHGRITKKGDKITRWLLIEAANVLLTRVKDSFPLKEWGLELAQRKGMAKAKVAVARRLAGLLYTLWLTESDFTLQAA